MPTYYHPFFLGSKLKDNSVIKKTVYARAGLAGNPSDGFYGKTISACIRNFCAEVLLEEDSDIVIQRNHFMDPMSFHSVDDLIHHSEQYGYYGALRLIHATCSLFFKTSPVKPVKGRGFHVKYTSTIPRQVGLGGSSAIVVALLKALIEFTGTEEYFPPARLAMLAWRVEHEELGITAGLQDRVIQAYGGLLFMDFDKTHMAAHGHGIYERLDAALLPPAFIAYTHTPRKFSGQMHNPIRFAYEEGNQSVIRAMWEFARYAAEARKSLAARDYIIFGNHMRMNWELRRALYGDELLGKDNLEMIEIASGHGCPAKLPGSGGAVIGIYERTDQLSELINAYGKAGYSLIEVEWDDGRDGRIPR